MTTNPHRRKADKDQKAALVTIVRAAGADEDDTRWEGRPKAVAKPQKTLKKNRR